MRRRRGDGAFTLLEVVIATTLLSVVFLAFATAFGIARERQESSTASTSSRTEGQLALDIIAREIEASAPGLVDTQQRSATATGDVFDDPLSSNCTSASCAALSRTGAGLGLIPVEPAKWLGCAYDAGGSLGPSGAAWTSLACGRSTVCPLDGAPLQSGGATDAVLFLSPFDVDVATSVPSLTTALTPSWKSIVVYAPWVDARGRGSIRRYALSWARVLAAASVLDASVATLPRCLEWDTDDVLATGGTATTNLFYLTSTSIVWDRRLASERAVVTFDRKTGSVTWNFKRDVNGGGADLDSTATNAATVPVRTLASGVGHGCTDFAVSTMDSAPLDPIADRRRVRLALALGGMRATSRGRSASVVVSATEAVTRNRP